MTGLLGSRCRDVQAGFMPSVACLAVRRVAFVDGRAGRQDGLLLELARSYSGSSHTRRTHLTMAAVAM